jgi:hypothetical protein
MPVFNTSSKPNWKHPPTELKIILVWVSTKMSRLTVLANVKD